MPAATSLSALSVLLVLLGTLCAAAVQAQQDAPTLPAAAVAAPAAAAEAIAQPPPWRSTAGYRFQAIAQTVADLQNLAHAMNLRELCANSRVPDAFVRRQLDRFSAISGRDEDCQSLRDY